MRLTHWNRDKHGRHFPDDIFKRIFQYLNFEYNFTTICYYGFNDTALVEMMAWRGTGDKPLSELGLRELIIYHDGTTN